MKITNNSGIPLSLAVWLIHDEYDYVEDVDNYISVTSLMKPLKQIILPKRIPLESQESDVADYIARKLGHAIHDSIEQAWIKGARRSLKLLGHPDSVLEKILVNPTTEQLKNTPDAIVVWLENRGFREIIIDGVVHTVGGKFDMVSDGILNDNKSTSAYTWVHGTRDEEHQLQMSLYNWIDKKRTDGENPRVTEDICHVNYIFTDWQKAQARSNPKYPQSRVAQKTLTLLSLEETEAWVINKIRTVMANLKASEANMPRCTDAELWRDEPKYKYFSDPEKAKIPGSRSTKNFESLAEANKYKADQGKGVVLTIPGEVKACGYCPAFDICEQRKEYFPDV